MGLNIRPVVTGGTGAAVASYDYYDIAEGTGTKTFTGLFFRNQTSSGAFLVSDGAIDKAKEVLKDTGYTLVNTATALTKGISLDFDLAPFNTPKIMKGTGYFLGSWILGDTSTAVQTSGSIVVKIKKWDGVTETVIAQASGAYNYISSSTYSNIPEVIKFAIPVTNYKPGDILRVGAELYYVTASNENKIRLALNYNPLESTLSGAFKILIPFKLEV